MSLIASQALTPEFQQPGADSRLSGGKLEIAFERIAQEMAAIGVPGISEVGGG